MTVHRPGPSVQSSVMSDPREPRRDPDGRFLETLIQCPGSNARAYPSTLDFGNNERAAALLSARDSYVEQSNVKVM